MEPERPAIPPSPKPVGVIEQLPQEHYKASSPPVALRSASSRDVQDLFSYVIINYFVFALLNTSNGLVNHLLMGLGMPAINWYASPQYWPVILTLVNLWKNAGFWSIVYLAGIIAINPEYYESVVPGRLLSRGSSRRSGDGELARGSICDGN